MKILQWSKIKFQKQTLLVWYNKNVNNHAKLRNLTKKIMK